MTSAVTSKVSKGALESHKQVANCVDLSAYCCSHKLRALKHVSFLSFSFCLTSISAWYKSFVQNTDDFKGRERISSANAQSTVKDRTINFLSIIQILSILSIEIYQAKVKTIFVASKYFAIRAPNNHY